MKTTNNLGQLLGNNNELFNHCWVLRDELPDVTIGIEPWDRDLTSEDMDKIYDLIDENKKEIIAKIGKADGIIIIDFVFHGAYDGFIDL